MATLLMANIDCKVDVIRNRHGNRALGRTTKDYVNWGVKTHPKCGQHPFTSWALRLNTKEKVN